MAIQTKKKTSKPLISGGRTSLLTLILRGTAILFLALCLFGVFDQLVLAGTVMNWTTDTAKTIGHNLEYIFNGDDEAPVDITDHGIYVDGHAPDGSKPLIDESPEDK